MSFSADSSIANLEALDRMALQAEYITDCRTLTLFIENHLNGLEDLIGSILKRQLDIIKDFLPILSLPSPDPVSIVKWLGKLVLGSAWPQLQAMIKYTISIIKILTAIQRIISAIERNIENLSKCVIDIAAISIYKLEADLANSVATNLTKIGQTQVLMNQIQSTVTGKLSSSFVSFDVSSSTAFLDSVEKNYDSYSSQISDSIHYTPPIS